MRIGVFHSEKNRDTALAIGKIMTCHSGQVTYYDTGKIWNKEYCKNPLLVMDKLSHLLYIHSADSQDLGTFAFFSGYSLGKGIKVLVLETDGRMELPENCRHLGVMLRPESFEDFFIAEKIRFKEEDKRIRARKELMDKGISCFDENFILIAGAGDAESVFLFLEAGFDPNLIDSKGVPVLSLAVRAQFPAVASLLIASGADVNRQSADRGYSPMMDAAQKGDLAMVRLLLDNGALPDLQSKDGQTALIICTGRGDGEMAKLLLEHGADPRLKDHLGMSAEGYARLFGNRKLMELFNISPA